MPRMKDYLMDRAMRRNDSRGGYVVNDRNYDYRGKSDYNMGYTNYDSKRGGRMDYNDYHEPFQDPNRNFQYNREHNRYDEYKMYGPGMNKQYNQSNDYAGYRDYNDYRDYREYRDYRDYSEEEQKYKKHLKEWEEKLKRKDRFGVPKEQIIKQAKNMDVKFDEFDEEEFYTIYLMHISDYPKNSNDYNNYISMAKSWLEDDDVKMKGGDKLCAYLYTIVLGKKEDED